MLLIPTKLIQNLALKFRSAGNIWPPLEALNDELEDLVLLNDDLLLAVNKSNINKVKQINSKPAIVPTPIPEQKMIQERTNSTPQYITFPMTGEVASSAVISPTSFKCISLNSPSIPRAEGTPSPSQPSPHLLSEPPWIHRPS